MWRRRRKHAERNEAPVPFWARRLGAIGDALDRHPEPLHEMAVMVAGRQAWATGLALRSGRLAHSWVALNLPFPDLDALAAPTASAGAWAMRLQSVGTRLDADPRTVRDPCLVPQGAGWLVTAIVQERETDAATWAAATWRLDDMVPSLLERPAK
jgi:hypothetical protein